MVQPTRAEVTTAIGRLGRLSETEYGRSLASLLGKPRVGDWDDDLATRQLGRLVGIEMKRPFARPRVLKRRNEASRARRAWNLKGPKAFDRELNRLEGQPEARILEILTEAGTGGTPARRLTPYEVAQYLHHETGWLRDLAVWLHPRLCADKSRFNQLRKALGDAGAVSLDVAIATNVAAVLSQALTGVPMSVLVGMSLFIIRQGATGFCKWSGNLQRRPGLARDEI